MIAKETKEPDDNALVQAFAPLHRGALGTGVGIVLGTLFFLATLVSLSHDVHSDSPLTLLAQYFFGYSVTFKGAFIGLVWGFASGFLLGWLFALIRNLAVWIYLVTIRSRAEMEQYSDFLDH